MNKDQNYQQISMRLKRLYYRNTCLKSIAVTIWNIPEHCNDVTQGLGLFQFVNTKINK